MDYLLNGYTDVGTTKATNQDSYMGQVVDTSIGRIAFGILCDGMGGLTNGEVASATVVNAFKKWIADYLPQLCDESNAAGQVSNDNAIVEGFTHLAQSLNERIKAYGRQLRSNLGTTLVAILITPQKFYVINVGDSRAYLIDNGVTVITKDQTVVAREVEQGRLTPEQAMVDPRRSVLLQCIGASDTVNPDIFIRDTSANAVYMLCSDGFRHEITEEEIYYKLNPSVILDKAGSEACMRDLVEACKARGERDNISCLLIRTIV